MEHYFISKEHKQEDYFSFMTRVNELTFEIKSCDSVFSKDEVDYGTNLLIKTVLKEASISGKILDIGCGYGIISMAIARSFGDVEVHACDINSTAVELTKFNAQRNHIKNITSVVESDAYSNITDKYNFIVTNPPIKAGKQNLLNILLGAYDYLLEDGELWFVIKKKHGEDSVKKALQEKFSSVEVVKRDKGYYIIRAVK